LCGNCSLPTEWIAVAATSPHCFSFEFVLRSKSVANCDWTGGQLVYETKAKIRPKWGSGGWAWVGKPFGWRQIAFCNGKHQPPMHGEKGIFEMDVHPFLLSLFITKVMIS